MRRVLIGLLVLGLCAWRTHERAQDWRSDQALWSAAVRTAPTLPRPRANLGAALLRTGRFAEASEAVRQAARLADQPAHARMRREIRRHLWSQLQWIDGAWPVCDQPAFSALCASWE